MKKYLFIILIVIIFKQGIFAQVPPYDKNWEIIFVDNFNSFNNNRWSIVDYHHHGEEPQIYRANNVYIDNGELVLQAKKGYYFCNNPNCNDGGIHLYSSGQINSVQKYQYGYFEIICKLPKGKGFWPAFWTVDGTSTPPCWYNEIDIFEMDGTNPHQTTTNLHWSFGNCDTENQYLHDVFQEHPCPDYSINYNSYSIEWSPNIFVWYVNQSQIRMEPNTVGTVGLHYPQELIVNLAISPWNKPNNTTPFPSYMRVDKINVYQLKMDCNTSVYNIFNFNTFYYAVKKHITLTDSTIIPTYSNITLRATDGFELKDGFEVPLECEFALYPTSCY